MFLRGKQLHDLRGGFLGMHFYVKGDRITEARRGALLLLKGAVIPQTHFFRFHTFAYFSRSTEPAQRLATTKFPDNSNFFSFPLVP